MKKLEKKIKLRGLGFDTPVYASLLERTDKKAIYERKDPNGVIYYEVFLIRKSSFPVWKNGKVTDRVVGELYPGNEAFGDWAWCYKYSGAAWAKYESL
jgi:hypothetical protein